MIYRRIDANGDYTFGQGKFNFVSGTEAVAQAIKTNLLLLYNEWFEDLEVGTPLFQKILNQRANENGKRAVDVVIRERILSTKGVIQLDSFSAEYDNKNKIYKIAVSAVTEYGNIESLEIEMGV